MGFDFTAKVDPNASRAIYLQLQDIIEDQINTRKRATVKCAIRKNCATHIM